MTGRGRIAATACALAAAFGAWAPAAPAQEQGEQPEDRYALAGGCWVLRSQALGRYVVDERDGYRAAAPTPEEAAPFRLQATELGRYLLYGKRRDFLAGTDQGVVSQRQASWDADWRVDGAPGAFRLDLPERKRALAAGPDGRLRLAAGEPGAAGQFTFERADGCAEFPEVEVNATGEPLRGKTPYAEVRGLVDAHMHMMAFEFLGGRAHCGRPWHRWGVEHALVDCVDHAIANGAAAILENFISYGNPLRMHDPVGWPTFKDWPHHASLTHEQSYYKWLERAWRGGLRIFVNLMVENAALCKLYPFKQNSCNEMDSVRLQIRRIRQLENYIDAQWGGPGKGWFRIVTSPFEARRVINEGKLAVVLGIEVSQLFNCNVYNDVPQCGVDDVDRQLEEFHALGIRDMELINKFDNAFGGVAGDAGITGVVVNAGNKLETGKFWQLQPCSGHVHADGTIHEHVHDRTPFSLPGIARDSLIGNGLLALLPPGLLPVYTEGPQCNARGLTPLGEHLVRRMIEKRMIIDPDHLSVAARNGVLALLEAAGYSGVVSSHSWSTPDAYPRIYALGGFITPYAGSSRSFVQEWRRLKPQRSKRHYFGFGYGADMNGFGAQGGPRNHRGVNPVRYPFTSFDGGVTLDRQRSGRRVFDINEDGVAHYGLYPDWVEDLRMIAGDEIVEDMARGAEAYLQMWERAEGIAPAYACRAARGTLSARGLGRVRLGLTAEELLRRAGQPLRRGNRRWTWCAKGRGGGEVTAVLGADGRVAMVASTARGHRAGGIGPGARASRLAGTRAAGKGLRVRDAGGGARIVYGVRGGKVRFVAVAARSVAQRPGRLTRHLRLAGLRR
jgi:microsomal dipeptidase-like Zn-dependent dipeptidase